MKNNNSNLSVFDKMLAATRKGCAGIYNYIGELYQVAAEKRIAAARGIEYVAKQKLAPVGRSVKERANTAIDAIAEKLFAKLGTPAAKRRAAVALASIAAVAIVTGAIGGVIAYLNYQSETVTNTFSMGTVGGDIEEDFDDGDTEKKDVTVKNTGTIESYVRAAIIINWKTESGEISPTKPVLGTDYSLSLGSDWTLGSDGFYYYKESIAAGESTTNLINSCKVLKTNGDYHLDVYVMSNTIQADPDDAVSEAWGVTGSNGTLTVS